MPIVTVPLGDLHWEVARAMRGSTPIRIAKGYSEVLDELPPLVCFQDGPDGELIMGEGIQRLDAHCGLGKSEITVEVRQGTRRDAYLHAVAANQRHGLPRTCADKREVVKKLLADATYNDRSDEWFAQSCRVSRPFVAGIRKRMHGQADTPRLGLDGKVRKLPRKGPGVRGQESAPVDQPEMTPRDRALAAIRRAKAEVHDAIHDTEKAERLLRDGSTRLAMNALKATKRELNVWESDLDRRPPVPPVPDPNDQSEEGQMKIELYRLARMGEEEVINLARKMLSHDRAQLSAREGRKSRGSTQPETFHPATSERGTADGTRSVPATLNQPETLHPSDRGSQGLPRTGRGPSPPRAPPDG